MYNIDDTIAAVSTAMSPGGISIIRISGPEAIDIADRVYEGKNKLKSKKTYTVSYGHIKEDQNIIDEVLVILLRSPGSYTGEDTVEINCHGGVYITKKILECVLKAGARMAEPGEFTKRAFLNGKMDLSQAEAVGDLISSENDYALQTAINQLKGSTKEKVNHMRAEILHHTALIESALDDPEHYSLDGYEKQLEKAAEGLITDIKKILATYDDGKILKEGIKTVILGKPNVGKSSFMNALSGGDKAIVTPVAGTTRDIIEEHVNIDGITLRLLDTAGIHDTKDIVEKIGIEKAKKELKTADLLIYVVDASLPLVDDEFRILGDYVDKPCMILLNKTDLECKTDERSIEKKLNEFFPAKAADKSRNRYHIIKISALRSDGIDEFKRVLKELFYEGNIAYSNPLYAANERQKEAFKEAQKSLKNVLKSIRDGMPEDFFSIDLMDCYASLGKIVGDQVGEDLVNEIFSKFCMGK